MRVGPGRGGRGRGALLVLVALVGSVLAGCAGLAGSMSPVSSVPASATTTTTAAATMVAPAIDPASGLATVAVGELPPEARDTIRLVRTGGPFGHSQDGAIFQNREGILPARDSSYYREYTVETPGSADRGARRIVAGRNGEMYYTDDHYASFRRIVA
jgi:ribonuclease T1